MKRLTNSIAGSTELEAAAAVIVARDEPFAQELRDCAEACGARVLLAISDGRGTSLRSGEAASLSPDVVFLEPEDNPASLEAGILSVKAHYPRAAVVVVQKAADGDAILESFRAGADEYVFDPTIEKLRSALNRVVKRHHAPRPNGSRIIGVLAAKGGCGATTLAWHLAGALQATGSAKTLLCDLDLRSGVLGFLTKASSRFTVQDALINMHRLDASYWSGLVSKCAGFDAMAAPPPGPFPPPGPSQMRGLLEFMRTAYSWSVLDLGSGLQPFTLDLLPEIDDLLLVSGGNPLSAAAVTGILAAVRDAGLDDAGVRVVLNAAPEPAAAGRTCRAGAAGLEAAGVWATLPFTTDLEDAYVEGKPLDSRSRFGAQVAQLARNLAGVAAQPSAKRKSLFAACSQLFGRKSSTPQRSLLGGTADQCVSG